MDSKEIILEKIKFRIEQRLNDKNLLSYTNVDYFEDSFSQNIVFSLESYLWGEKQKTKVIKYPLNWIEHFKERWFNDRLKKKWPVKYKEINIDFNVLYPNFRPILPNEDYRVQMRVW